MIQHTFDELRRARTDDPETSKAAAARSHGLASHHCALIREALAVNASDAVGLSAHEIAASCGLDPVQVSRRLGQMRDDGEIVATGNTRPTATGRAAQCWRLA